MVENFIVIAEPMCVCVCVCVLCVFVCVCVRCAWLLLRMSVYCMYARV